MFPEDFLIEIMGRVNFFHYKHEVEKRFCSLKELTLYCPVGEGDFVVKMKFVVFGAPEILELLNKKEFAEEILKLKGLVEEDV